MKKIKKLLLLALACLTYFTVGAFSACGDDDKGNSNQQEQEKPDDETPAEYVYKVRTQSEGGFGLRNVNVTLYDGDTVVASVNTNSNGDAFFTDEHVTTLDNYRIAFTNVPNGWFIKNENVTYQTSTVRGSNINVNFIASLITDEGKNSSSPYKLGEVVHDFAIKDTDGNVHQISSILQEKKMVMINLWATWCGPCASEFPPMNQAYNMYKDDVEILAISTDSGDTQSKVAAYKAEKSLNFPMIGSPDSTSAVNNFFDNTGVPVTIIIDRYGVVSYKHTGNMLAITDFTSLFDKFVGDNYAQTVIDPNAQDGDENGSGSVEMVKPDISNPNLSDVKAAFSGKESDFVYSWEDEDEYSWPWLIGKEGDNSYLEASNKFLDNSYSILNIDFTAQANTTLVFDYTIATEKDADFLYVLIDGTIIHSLSGVSGAWETCYSYVFEEEHVGEHTLSLIYIKDSSDSGDDVVRIRNLRFESKSTIVNQEGLDLNILRHAATEWNDPDDYQEGDAKTAKFDKYVNVKLGADGYYHVIPENAAEDYVVDLDKDPLLFADLMNSNRWNKFGVWQLAYNGMLVYNGIDLAEPIENFAWGANESMNGYIPVTPALKELLDMIAQIKDIIGEAKDETDSASRVNYFDKNCHLSYHENEWLENCLYFDHYGNTPVMEDPTKGITFDGAIEIYEGANHIDVFKSMVPVGIKHKFTPTKSGVYHFYSTFSTEYFGKSEKYNPYMWLVDSDQKTFLAENDDFLLHKTDNPENFDIKYYLEAGKTYYCIFSLFLNSINEFDMNIDYLGSYYENFTNCAIGPYTMNMITYKVFLPNTKNVLYDEANDVYRVANKDGVFLGDIYEGLDDKVYLDLTNATIMFPYNTLSSYIESYENYDKEKRLFYLPDENGEMKDYSPIMADYLFESRLNNGELRGKIAVNQELMYILLELTKEHDGFGGVKNSWQMLCYYYQPIGQQQ